MSNLDDKLREILQVGWDTHAVWSETIERIKQALADEGYVVLTTYNVPKGGWKKDGVVLEPSGPYLFDKESKKMTGQEWYDRFDKEMRKTRVTSIDLLELAREIQRGAYEAARRAAGLK